MSYEFKLDIGNKIVEVEYKGMITFEERMLAIKEGLAILKDREYPRILINLLAAKMDLSNSEKIELASYISVQHSLLKAKTAFLIRCEQTAKEEVDEAVLRADNFVSQVFFSRTRALEWLGND